MRGHERKETKKDEDGKTGGRGRRQRDRQRTSRETVEGARRRDGEDTAEREVRAKSPRQSREPGQPGLTKVNGVLRSVIMRSATARLTMKRLVAECIRWFLKMT